MIKEILKNHLIPREDYLFGFANLKGLIDGKFGDFYYAISILKKLDDNIIDSIKTGPNFDYFNHYNKVNDELFSVASKIADDLERNNIKTIVIKPTVSTEELEPDYKNTLRTDFSHKMAATRAGLGWIGKTDLLVTRVLGPRVRMATILTNKKLEPESKPYEVSACGSCQVCVLACPAKAANGKPWNILVDRDKFFNPFKCREMCNEFGETRLKHDIRLCGICMAVCPFGAKKMAGVSSGLAN
jgi:epoxyqueuosine reductase